MNAEVQFRTIVGIIKNVKRHAGDKSSTISVTSVSTQKDYNIFCSFFCPARKNDVLSGICLVQTNGTYEFARCPVVEPSSTKDAVQTVFIIGMGKLKMSQSISDRVYRFFEQEAERKIKMMKIGGKLPDKGSSDFTIFRNRDSLNAAVMETISWYANSFRTDESTAEPLINLGLSKEQAHKLLRSWYRDICLRRLYLLGLTRKEIRECCKRGWAGAKGIVNSPDALYYQLLENPYIPEKIPLSKAKDIASRYGLTFSQDIMECADLIRFVDEQTLENGWACFPIFSLIKRYPRFNELCETLKTQFKCTLRYNFFYLRYQAEVEDTLLKYLQPIKLPETHVSENTKNLLSPEQITAVELSLNNSVSIITGAGGSGKCLSPDTTVLLANGDTKCAKDIVVGDHLIGDDSTYRTVCSTCSGEDNMYRIIPSKGRSFTCNEPHILTLKGIVPYIVVRKDRNLQYIVRYTINGNGKCKEFLTNEEANIFVTSLPEDIFDIPLNKYLKMSKEFKANTFLFHTGVDFYEEPLHFDPYLLGVWLGDGSSSGTKITVVDEEILNYLRHKLPEYNLKLSDSIGLDGITYNILGACSNDSENYFTNILKYHDLSGNKHIPDVYKINSRTNRLKLLAGLIDTDGYKHQGNYLEISTKNDQLANDIEYLAFSLGFMVTRKNDLKSCMYKGEISEGFYNQLSIFGEGLEEIPVLLERKKCHPRQSKVRAACLSFKVVPLGRGPYCGFTLDGNGRFLLGDFLVTHNTQTIASIVQELELRDISYCIGSFTGIAVSNIKKMVRRRENIMTLHMMLSKGKVVDRLERPVKVLIIDEISMVANELLAKVLLKLNYALDPDERLHVIFVGDPNQVQPIEWGDFCNQVMMSWIPDENDETRCKLAIPWIRLTEDHRRRVKGVLFNNLAQFSTAEQPEDIFWEWGDDCEFIPGGIPEVEAKVRSLYQQGVSSSEVTIVSPINKGLDDLNIRCQNIFINEHTPQIQDAFGKIWKLGARVMMTVNRYDINIMNGEQGTIINIFLEKSVIKVRFESGTEVDIPTFLPVIIDDQSDMEDPDLEQPLSTKLLVLSWAVTIHKAQGSQFTNVIFLVPSGIGRGSFFNRNMLYTGASRPRDHLTVIAQYETTFTTAILVNPPHRYDNLAKRLKCEPFVDKYINPAWQKQQEIIQQAMSRVSIC